MPIGIRPGLTISNAVLHFNIKTGLHFQNKNWFIHKCREKSKSCQEKQTNTCMTLDLSFTYNQTSPYPQRQRKGANFPVFSKWRNSCTFCILTLSDACLNCISVMGRSDKFYIYIYVYINLFHMIKRHTLLSLQNMSEPEQGKLLYVCYL